VLKNGEGLVANREFYLAARNFANQQPDRVKTILSAAQKVDNWAATKPTEVATLLSPQLGIDVPTLEIAAKRRPYGVQPITNDVITYQQQVADSFYRLGLIPKQLNVSEVAQLPKQ
jgi:sulfonate transport system substrate-binding protein